MRSIFAFAVALCVLPAALPAKDPSGISNFHQVNPHVYRGAQPTPAGFAELAKMGVATVIDLREPGSRSDTEREIVTSQGMKYITVPMQGMSAPSSKDLARVLAVLNDESAGPVFVHCRRGADRTGTVIACYRIEHDHWANAKALAEARANHMSWIERSMQSFIRSYKAPVAAATAVPTAQ